MMQPDDDGDMGEGDDGEDPGEDEMYELDEEQYQQLLMQMQQNQQNMLIDQQDGDVDPRQLDPQQLAQLQQYHQMQ